MIFLWDSYCRISFCEDFLSTLQGERNRIFLEFFGGHLEGDKLVSFGLKFCRVTVLRIFGYRGVWLISQYPGGVFWCFRVRWNRGNLRITHAQFQLIWTLGRRAHSGGLLVSESGGRFSNSIC